MGKDFQDHYEEIRAQALAKGDASGADEGAGRPERVEAPVKLRGYRIDLSELEAELATRADASEANPEGAAATLRPHR